MAASLSPSEMLSVGWAGTVRAWQAQLGVGPGEAVRALCATTVTVDRGGALVQLTPPALFALESADQATQTKPWVFSEVFYSMARAWNGSRTPWHPDEGVCVDVSTLGALWLAGHIHYAAETFKSTRKIYRQSTSWVDRLLGEMLAPLGLMDQETHCRLLESTGPLMTTWKPGASAWLNTSVWGTAIFEGYRRHCKTSNGWPARRRQAWTESFLSVIRAGVVHAPSGALFINSKSGQPMWKTCGRLLNHRWLWTFNWIECSMSWWVSGAAP